MQEHGQPFTLEELARQVNLPVRTIRYYIAEGLLPGPGARGKAATYGEEHLLKLRLIRRLSERRMPLADMQALLPRLSMDEVRSLLMEEEKRTQELEQSTQDRSAKSYIEKLLENAQAERPVPSEPGGSWYVPSPPALPRVREVPPTMPPTVLPPAPAPSAPVFPSTGESWQRWELAPGVELHVRADAEIRQRSLIERIFRAVGKVFRPTY
jgi:DNA-binding transcriptional MerR regulator